VPLQRSQRQRLFFRVGAWQTASLPQRPSAGAVTQGLVQPLVVVELEVGGDAEPGLGFYVCQPPGVNGSLI